MIPSLKNRVLNPFEFISETKALIIGLFLLIIANILNSSTLTHFNGLIDYHTNSDTSYSVTYHFIESAISLIVFSTALYISALIISKSKIRYIDVISMQALAKAPYFISALIPLFYSIDMPISYFDAKKNNLPLPNMSAPDWIALIFYVLIIILLLIWTVALMWNAYKMSCNVKGTKAIVSFIIAFVVADIIIKLTLYNIKDYFIISQITI
jgi:Yip1 domain